MDVQGLALQSTFRLGEGPIGSFSSSIESSKAVVKSYLAMIASGEIDTPCPTDAYLAHRYRLDTVNEFWEHASPDDVFFLKHPDGKGDHILVNNSYDIVGIIDWEWTQTVSKAEVFSSPCLMWPLDEFYSGSNELVEEELRLAGIFEERDRGDLAECVNSGRKIQRFMFALGPEASYVDSVTFVPLFEGLRKAFKSSDKEEWQHWKNRALQRWKDDQFLRGLLKEHDD